MNAWRGEGGRCCLDPFGFPCMVPVRSNGAAANIIKYSFIGAVSGHQRVLTRVVTVGKERLIPPEKVGWLEKASREL